jgi:AcrR family transcriptional regulator
VAREAQGTVTGIAPRNSRARRRADRRGEILEAAREVFSEKGYEGTSMAEIAARVGIVEGAIYKHFPSKRDLLFEGVRAFYAPLIESTREQLAAIRGTRNRLRFVIWRQLKAFVEEPGVCRLIIEEIRPKNDYNESVVRELNRKATSAVLGIIQEGIEQGELRADISPATVRDVIYGGIEHLAWKALTGRGPLEVDRLADELTELILRGAEVRCDAEPTEAAAIARLEAQVERLERALDALLGQRAGREGSKEK